MKLIFFHLSRLLVKTLEFIKFTKRHILVLFRFQNMAAVSHENVAVRPCKLEYESDSNNIDSDTDSDPPMTDSDSDIEPDFLYHGKRDGNFGTSGSCNIPHGECSTTTKNNEETKGTGDTGGSPDKPNFKWKECKNNESTQKNISFAPSRKGINVDLISPNSTPLQCLHAILTDQLVEGMMVLINDHGRKEFKTKERNIDGHGEGRGQGENSNSSSATVTPSSSNTGGTESRQFDIDSNDESEYECEDEDNSPWEDSTLGEMYKYLLVLVSMSIHARPGMNFDYIWGKNYIFTGEWFCKIIPQQRFLRISKLLREIFKFSDVNCKSLARGMVKSIMKNSQAAFYPGKHLNVEELIVGKPRQGWTHISYDIGVPDNHRVKTLGLIDNETSYIVDLFVCYGPSNKCYNPKKLDANCFVKILDQLLSSCFEGHHLNMDKNYSHPSILKHLEQKFYYTGHIDVKRHPGIPEKLGKEKLKVGEIKWYIDEDDKNLIANYRDTKYKWTSALISNHADVKTEFSQGMTMPAMFHEYNLTIKGSERVHDAMDQYGHFTEPEKNWDKKFLQWLFEIIQLNAFVLYKQSQPKHVKEASFYKFKRILASELCCHAGKLYNEEFPETKEDGCLCYRYEIPDMPKMTGE